MDLKDILAISGQPGLYKLVAQGARGVIVEALADGKRQNIPPTARVSSMTEIAVFTDGEEKPLQAILQDIFRVQEGKEAVSHKDSAADITAFFGKVVPDYDRERVHVSDMKKIVQWYNTLLNKGLIDLEEPQEEISLEETEAQAEKKAEKPAEKKAAAKTKAPKVSTTSKAAAPKLTRGKKG